MWIRGLYEAVQRHAGSGVFDEVLTPWLDQHAVELREMLAPLSFYGGWRRAEYDWGDLLEKAYALSRVSDLLLLGFQPDLPAHADSPWAHELHRPDRYPMITEDEYVSVFAALGMRRVRVARFDPFFHEIVTVEQTEEPSAPIEITGGWWPCLMLGELLFGRAGVSVRAGERHAVAGIADRSMLHEVFLRRYRPTSDMSLGWGHNSQWKTDFRRDYLTADSYYLNVDAETELGEDSEFVDLLRHRCAVRPFAQEENPWPAGWRLRLPRR